MGEKFLYVLGRPETWTAGAALAAFLVLVWVLRGAPLGQAATPEDAEDAGAPGSGHRDRTIVAVAVGLLLILAGAVVAVTRGVAWSVPLFALGFGLVLVLIGFNRRYRQSSPALRRTIDLSSSLLNLALLTGVLIIVNVLAFRYGGKPLDLTREGSYTLSSQTLNLLKALDRPVTFTVIAGGGAEATAQRQRVMQLLESYQTFKPQLVKIEGLNPYLDLNRLEELTKRTPELGLMHGGGVLIEYGEGAEARSVVARNREMFEGVRAGGDRFESTFNGEDAITSALLRLREGTTVKVAFTTGHGEPRPDDLTQRGLGDWKARLARVGCAVVEVNLVEQAVPDDAALLVVAGPVDPFQRAEAAKVLAYAERGRPVLMLLGNAKPSGLEDVLKAHNLVLGKGLIVDPRSNYKGSLSLVVAPTSGSGTHPITTATGANRGVVLPDAAPIHLLGQKGPGGAGGEPANRNLVPSVVLKTGPAAWAETDLKSPRPVLGPDEERGPLQVGVAVAWREPPPPGGAPTGQPPAEKPRLVLFSSAMMGANLLQDVPSSANLDLLMNAASWLRGRPDTLGIPGRSHVALSLAVDSQFLSRLILVPTVTAILSIIAVGTIVFAARRQ